MDSSGEPIVVSQTSPGPCSSENPFTNMWTTNVVVKYPDGGPVPDTATYIQKLEREREARERGEAKDNRPFLSRYVSVSSPIEYVILFLFALHIVIPMFQWMYIFLAFIFIVLSAATNPEAAGTSGGSAQRQ